MKFINIQIIMSEHNKHANLHLSSDNKSSTVSPNLRFIISEKFEIKDLENLKEINLAAKIRDFKQIDQFLNYIESNNLNIFLPSDCFITVFHSLVRSWRWTDFSFGQICYKYSKR